MSLRVVFLGRPCEFTRLPFQALLEAGVAVIGLIIPSPAALPAHSAAAPSPGLRVLPPPSLPMAPQDVIGLAHARRVPVFTVADLSQPASVNDLAALRPDLLCVACFPKRLPPAWLQVPRLGGLNLHPSLLPAYRGPEPLFWQFRDGATSTGVSLHCLDERLDTGDLVRQAGVVFADGLTGAEAERLTATAGAQLLVEAVTGAGWPRRPQPAEGASYFGRPTEAARLIATAWPARRAFNFIRGAGEWGLTIEVDGARLNVAAALDYSPEAEGGPALQAVGEAWDVRFTPGRVRVRGRLI